jgi:hypothetical protein
MTLRMRGGRCANQEPAGRGGVNGTSMEPPQGNDEERPRPHRSSRILGLIAAVGFSVAMWVFIGMAVLGLVLKVFGSRG